MSAKIWQLSRDGSFALVSEAEATEGATVLELAHVHNGTVFSQAAQLIAQRGNGGSSGADSQRLILRGPVIPDQARQAFQVGFDAILLDQAQVERHSEAAWRGALAASLSSTYVYTSAGGRDQAALWSLRHS